MPRYPNEEFDHRRNRDRAVTTPPLFSVQDYPSRFGSRLTAVNFTLIRKREGEEGESVILQDRLDQLHDKQIGAWDWRWNHWCDLGPLKLLCPSSRTETPFALFPKEVGYERRLREKLELIGAFFNFPDWVCLNLTALHTLFDRIWYAERHCYKPPDADLELCRRTAYRQVKAFVGGHNLEAFAIPPRFRFEVYILFSNRGARCSPVAL